MANVYAPQQPSRYDATMQMWIPSMNLMPAEKYGKVVVLLPPNVNSASTVPLVAVMKERMSSFSEEDSIIAVGDPSLIAAAACIACRKTGGTLRLLKWDRQAKDYIMTELKI